MLTILVAIDICFILLFLFSVYAVLNPGRILNFTLKKTLSNMKFYAFDAKISPTPKSISIIRTGHLIIAIALAILISIISYYILFS